MNTNDSTSRYSPTGSVAQAMTKGLSSRLINQGLHNEAQVIAGAHRGGAGTYAGAYKRKVGALKLWFKGFTIHTEERGRGKNRVFTLVGFDTSSLTGNIVMVWVSVSLRNEGFDHGDAPVAITRHAWERISQRHAGLSPREMLLPVKTVFLNYKTIPHDPGKYEVGVGCGIFIAARDTYRGDLTLVTFISKDKCTMGQDCSIGAIRKLRSTS